LTGWLVLYHPAALLSVVLHKKPSAMAALMPLLFLKIRQTSSGKKGENAHIIIEFSMYKCLQHLH